jgi:hypothetical protein
MTALPTFHLNGSSPDDLLNEYRRVYEDLKRLEESFQRATCHPRDFYVQEGDAWGKARKEREEMGLHLAEFSSYVEDWVSHCYDNIRKNKV